MSSSVHSRVRSSIVDQYCSRWMNTSTDGADCFRRTWISLPLGNFSTPGARFQNHFYPQGVENGLRKLDCISAKRYENSVLQKYNPEFWAIFDTHGVEIENEKTMRNIRSIYLYILIHNSSGVLFGVLLLENPNNDQFTPKKQRKRLKCVTVYFPNNIIITYTVCISCTIIWICIQRYKLVLLLTDFVYV